MFVVACQARSKSITTKFHRNWLGNKYIIILYCYYLVIGLAFTAKLSKINKRIFKLSHCNIY